MLHCQQQSERSEVAFGRLSFQLGLGAAQEGRNDKLYNSDYQPDEHCIANGVVALSLASASFNT